MSLKKRKSLLTVIKVGGSLLAGQADLRRVATALAERHRDGGSLLVVASALKGVTDLLEQAAMQALDRRLRNGALDETLESLRRRHVDVARDINVICESGSTEERVQSELGAVEDLVGSIRAAGELPEATYARLLSSGERLSVLLLAAALEAAGREAEPITAEAAGLRATGPRRTGACDLPASAAGLQRMRRHLADRILVLTGFYGVGGVGADGGVVLFGRGGSDDTACAVAAGLDADRLELWKDVPGFMSADPREVRDARVIREVSFAEVAQLGAYGSRVVNHGCLEPLRGRSTRIVISSLPQAGTGTVVLERLQRSATQVVALASRRNNGSPALIGAVGDGVGEDPEIRSRMLSALSATGARCDRPVQPSGRSGLSCAVHPDDLAAALGGLHEHFFAPAQ